VTQPPPDGLTLTEQTTRRYHANGITWDHPQLVRVREHNAAAFTRAGLPNPHRPPPEGTPDDG
jgi:hypothetical protein